MVIKTSEPINQFIFWSLIIKIKPAISVNKVENNIKLKYSFLPALLLVLKYFFVIVSKNNYFDLEETIPFASLSLSEDNIKNYSTKFTK